MGQTNINIRMDEDLKRNFDNVCNELGLNMSTAITIFAKKMSREKRIPFDVSIEPFYTESNMIALAESKNELDTNKIIVKTMEELEELTNG